MEAQFPRLRILLGARLRGLLSLSVVGIALILTAGLAQAEDYSLNDLQLLYTTQSKADPRNGTGTSDGDLAFLRAEHYGTWSYGNNYIALDLFMGDQVGGKGAGSFGKDVGRQYAFFYVPRFSLRKLFGDSLPSGFIKDVFVAYRMERASYGDFRSDNFGVSFDLAVPGVAFFEQDFYTRTTNYDHGRKWLSRTVWFAPFNVHGVGMHFDALVLIKSTDTSGTDVFAQPDLMFDILPKGTLQLGTRLEYHSARDYSRFTPYAMLKWIF
jgi:nucleoside-specific outer membrane channel protein Tsx